jgi:hypothetical protein
LQVTGAQSGTDKLVSIESVRGTGGADRVTGSLALLSVNAYDYQTAMAWAGMGGTDTVVQEKVTYGYWADSMVVNYAWSNTPITATANGAVITVSYGASSTGKTVWNSSVAQPAGTDSLSWVTSLSDTRYSDSIDLSGQTENNIGTAFNAVSITTGDDTVTGNGDTILSLSTGTPVTSSTGKGINFTLPGNASAVLDMTHMSYWLNSNSS